jgi:hypothetical protein
MDKATDRTSSFIPTLIPTLISASFTFLFGVIGVLIGGYWQQHYALQLEQEKNILELRRKAYAEFFEGQTALINSGAPDISAEDRACLLDKYTTLVKNARFHIAVYGARPTVEALAGFFEKYFSPSDCYDPQKYREDTTIYIRMREEYFGGREEEKVAPEKMTLLVHNCRLARS